MFLEELVQHHREHFTIFVYFRVTTNPPIDVVSSLSMTKEINYPLWTDIDIHHKGTDFLLNVSFDLKDLELNTKNSTYLPMSMVFTYFSP